MARNCETATYVQELLAQKQRGIKGREETENKIKKVSRELELSAPDHYELRAFKWCCN
jgi:hypothetical protein